VKEVRAMYELSDDPKQPTLSDRLREAAAERAVVRGEVVDEVMLDPDGVLDLRHPTSSFGGHATGLPSALAVDRGAGIEGIERLFAEGEPDRSLWERGRRLLASGASSSPALSAIPLADEVEASPEPTTVEAPDTDLSVVADDAETVIVAAPSAEPVDIDLTDNVDDDTRPTGQCPRCGGVGRRDLFDRFSQVDYFSCDVCTAMWQEPHT
jgi:hypothetical protein